MSDNLPALGNESEPCHSVGMDPVGNFTLTVFRDREFQWLFGPKHCRTFKTALDLRDPRSLNEAIAAEARRDMGDEANMDLYSLEVVAPDGSILKDYRYNAYFGEAYDSAWD